MAGSVTINGVTYTGNNIRVQKDGQVFVDGQEVTPNSRIINIHVQGDIDSLQVDTCEKVSVTGKVGPINTVSGDVHITGSVIGNVNTTSGDVQCGEVYGSVNTVSGDINQGK